MRAAARSASKGGNNWSEWARCARERAAAPALRDAGPRQDDRHASAHPQPEDGIPSQIVSAGELIGAAGRVEEHQRRLSLEAQGSHECYGVDGGNS